MADNKPTSKRNQSTAQTLNPSGLSSDDPVEGRRDVGGANENEQHVGQLTDTASGTVQRGTAQPKVAPSNSQGQH